MRFSPKAWLRPGSRRWFEHHEGGPDLILAHAEILKDLYPCGPGPEMKRPPWAVLARLRGWMTAAAYWRVPKEPTGRQLKPLSALVYAESPFLRMLKKPVWA